MPLVSIVTVSLEAFLIISQSTFALITIAPGSLTVACIIVFMPNSKSYPVRLSVSEPHSIRIPSIVGIVTFVLTARITLLHASFRFFVLQENFILILRSEKCKDFLIIMKIIVVVLVVVSKMFKSKKSAAVKPKNTVFLLFNKY